MNLFATINQVFTTGPDELNPVFNFTLTDDEETAEVSFTGTISLAHAVYVYNHEEHSYTAYYQMIEAIAEADDCQSLAGKSFTS